jgi:hypothetical protein
MFCHFRGSHISYDLAPNPIRSFLTVHTLPASTHSHTTSSETLHHIEEIPRDANN